MYRKESARQNVLGGDYFHQRSSNRQSCARAEFLRNADKRTTMQSSGNEAGPGVLQLRSRIQEKLGDSVRIVEMLGAHGPESLWRARDGKRGDDLFICSFDGDPATASDAHREFEQRAKSSALLDHPNIAPVGPLQRCEGLAYYIVSGGGRTTLESLLRDGKALAFDRCIAILRDVASALDYAHLQGVVHGQLEPASIGIGQSGAVVVSGFGLGTGIPFAHSGRSAAYMAPEQWQSNVTIDGSADIYALGVIAFEMITGRRRAISLSAKGVAMVDPLPLSLDRPLHAGIGLHVNQALMRAVSKRPTARFATAGDFVAMLEGRSHTPTFGLATQRPALDVERTTPFALVPMFLVAVAGILLGFAAAPSARQALRDSGHFSSITDGLDLRPSVSSSNGYLPASSGPAGSSATGNSASASGPSASGSQSLFPGAATAAGGGTAGAPTSAPSAPTLSPSPAVQSSGRGAASTSSGPGSESPRATDPARESAPAQTSDSSGFVRVELNGASGVVVIDGLPRGRSPFVGRLRAGTHSVSILSTSNVQQAKRQIVVDQGDTTVASFTVGPATPQ
jgi:serine/threonine protein kinase